MDKYTHAFIHKEEIINPGEYNKNNACSVQ